MYKTTVTPPSGKPFEAAIDYTIWSEVFTCPHCGGEVVFYDAAFDPRRTGSGDFLVHELRCRVDERAACERTYDQGAHLRWRLR